MTRALAAVCILAVLFTLLVPASAPPFLVAAGPALDAPGGAIVLPSAGGVAPPDLDPRTAVPARAPPFA